VPALNVSLSALVIKGASSTVSFNDVLVDPTLLVAVIVSE
jgi:hypothetical protein